MTDNHEQVALLLSQKYEELYNQNDTILQSLPVGIELYSSDGVLEFLNDRDCEIFGVSREVVLQLRLNLFDNPNLPEEVKDAVRNNRKVLVNFPYYFTKVEKCSYYQTTQETQQVKYIECSGTPVINAKGGVNNYVFIVEDITERKRMISELQEAKRQAEQSDNLKSAFLANMSHEIRTPLNAIVGFSDLMCSTITQEERDEYSKIINTNNGLLLKLINDILDLSKIEAGFIDLQLEKFDLTALLNETANSMQRRINHLDVTLTYKAPYESCIVELDKSRLTQILTNYSTNSIKYTPKGQIEMGYEYNGKAIRIYVKDTGIGISEEKRKKVFQRFEKLDQFAQGTGLGLSICKAIVDKFGGTIGFKSEEGKGSEFWAIIPCHAEINNAPHHHTIITL